MDIKLWDGKPISVPGIYRGVPISEYHSGKLCVGPSISSSGLRTIFSKSPAHYWATSRLNPERQEENEEESEALIVGRAVHHVILGEANFKEVFITRPDTAPDGRAWNGNNLSCKEWLGQAKQQGLTVLSPDHIRMIRGMAIALGKEPLVMAGALNGVVECSFVWQDEETGVWMLGRPDNTVTDSADFVDLKTTLSVAYPDLVSTIDNYGYHQQGALVQEGFEILTGRKMTSFSNYFIEKKYPHCCNLRQLSTEDLALGRMQNRAAVRTFAKCWNAKHWPGPGGEQRDGDVIKLSDRARERITKKLRLEGFSI